MSIEAYSWVHEYSPVDDPVDVGVLGAYANYADDHALAWPGAVKVGHWARVHPGTARRVTDRLVAGGHLALVRKGGGRGRPSVYRVVMDLDTIAKGSRPAPVSTGGVDEDPDHDDLSGPWDDSGAPDDDRGVDDDADEPPRAADANVDGDDPKGSPGAPVSGGDKRAGNMPERVAIHTQYPRETRAPHPAPPAGSLNTQNQTLNYYSPNPSGAGEPGTGRRAVDDAIAVLAVEQLGEAHTVIREGPRLRQARHETGLAWGARLAELAAAHPDADGEELARLCRDGQRAGQFREFLERRGRLVAVWATDSSSPAYDPGFAAMTEPDLVDFVTESAGQLIDPSWTVDKPPPDPALVAIAVDAFRAERARLLSAQSESQEVR